MGFSKDCIDSARNSKVEVELEELEKSREESSPPKLEAPKVESVGKVTKGDRSATKMSSRKDDMPLKTTSKKQDGKNKWSRTLQQEEDFYRATGYTPRRWAAMKSSTGAKDGKAVEQPASSPEAADIKPKVVGTSSHTARSKIEAEPFVLASRLTTEEIERKKAIKQELKGEGEEGWVVI